MLELITNLVQFVKSVKQYGKIHRIITITDMLIYNKRTSIGEEPIYVLHDLGIIK